MKKVYLLRSACIILSCTLFSGCSYLKSFLPDKERDYHYSQEIPPLVMPADLASNKFPIYEAPQVDTQAEEVDTTTVLQEDIAISESNGNEVISTTSELSTSTQVEDAAQLQAIANEEKFLAEAADVELATGNTALRTVTEQEFTDTDVELAATEENTTATATTVAAVSAIDQQNTQDDWDIALDQPIAANNEVDNSASAIPQNTEQAISQQSAANDSVATSKSSAQHTDKVRYVIFNDGSNRIQLDEDMHKAWRIVGKAISNNSIEITGRFLEQAQYEVQYDPDERVYQDGSLWDEVLFFFGDDQKQDKEYLVQLIAGDGFTDVVIVDAEGVAISEGNSLKLLQLIFRTIQADYENE